MCAAIFKCILKLVYIEHVKNILLNKVEFVLNWDIIS